MLKPNESPQFLRIFPYEPALPPAPLFNVIYPNPFKGMVRIQFQIPGDQNADLKIYDAVGRLITEFNDLANEPSNSIIWDGTDLLQRAVPSGIYYCILNIAGNNYTKKLILVK